MMNSKNCLKTSSQFFEYRLVKGDIMLAWIVRLPETSSRGKYLASIALSRTEKDKWPRYYFNSQYGKEEVEAYLKLKHVDLSGTDWIYYRTEEESLKQGHPGNPDNLIIKPIANGV